MYTFFWSGPFSQWHKSTMVIDGIKFNCCEQYMMYKKAMLFNDIEIAQKILKTFNPRDQKACGRLVKNFNQEIWEQNARQIVYEANLAKFTQSDKLKQILKDTGNTKLVEASPYDNIWGIGLDEEAAKKITEDQWPGTNWLGKALDQVKVEIFKND
jgi:ribA/ribD-fused uncharacterized protein